MTRMDIYNAHEDDRSVSISAVGHALIALEGELKSLERESEMLHTKLRIAHMKMSTCRSAIHKLLVNTVGPLYANSSADTKTELGAH